MTLDDNGNVFQVEAELKKVMKRGGEGKKRRSRKEPTIKREVWKLGPYKYMLAALWIDTCTLCQDLLRKWHIFLSNHC